MEMSDEPTAWTFVQALAWALVHFAWTGALIGVATALSLRLMRSDSLQIRYPRLCLSLLLCLAIPVFDVSRGIEAASRPSGWFRATDSLIVPTKHRTSFSSA